MQKQSEVVSSGLMSVFIGHDSELKKAMLAARTWCEEKLKLPPPICCSVSSYLYPDCKVIGGNTEVSCLKVKILPDFEIYVLLRHLILLR
jgi:hypothetical protein